MNKKKIKQLQKCAERNDQLIAVLTEEIFKINKEIFKLKEEKQPK